LNISEQFGLSPERPHEHWSSLHQAQVAARPVLQVAEVGGAVVRRWRAWPVGRCILQPSARSSRHTARYFRRGHPGCEQPCTAPSAPLQFLQSLLVVHRYLE